MVQWLVTGGLFQFLIGLVLLILLAKRAIRCDPAFSVPAMTGFLIGFLIVSVTEFVLTFAVSSQLFIPTVFAFATLLADNYPDSKQNPARPGRSSELNRLSGRGASVVRDIVPGRLVWQDVRSARYRMAIPHAWHGARQKE